MTERDSDGAATGHGRAAAPAARDAHTAHTHAAHAHAGGGARERLCGGIEPGSAAEQFAALGRVADVVDGAWRAQALGAALELKLFAHVGDAAVSAREVAGALGVEPGAVTALLEALAEAGLVERSGAADADDIDDGDDGDGDDGDEPAGATAADAATLGASGGEPTRAAPLWRAAPGVAALLDPRRARATQGFVQHDLGLVAAAHGRLGDALLTGTPAVDAGSALDAARPDAPAQETAREYALAEGAFVTRGAEALAAAWRGAGLAPAEHALEVGFGTAVAGLAWVESGAARRLTFAGRPAFGAAFIRAMRAGGHAEALRFVVWNPRAEAPAPPPVAEPFGPPYDLVFADRLLGALAEGARAALLGRLHAALAPGGRVVLREATRGTSALRAFARFGAASSGTRAGALERALVAAGFHAPAVAHRDALSVWMVATRVEAAAMLRPA